MEKYLEIVNREIRLEGMLQGDGRHVGVVVSHPHPLYGGDMDNPVVTAMSHAFFSEGCATLRFNFRGTGRSGGTHDHGAGEQTDILAAADCLRDAGSRVVLFAGYSFGAWTGSNLLAGQEEVHGISGCWMVSPPVSFIPFPEKLISCPCHILVGQEDTLGPPDKVREHATAWCADASLDIVPNTDHFWMGEGLRAIGPWIRRTLPGYL